MYAQHSPSTSRLTRFAPAEASGVGHKEETDGGEEEESNVEIAWDPTFGDRPIGPSVGEGDREPREGGHADTDDDGEISHLALATRGGQTSCALRSVGGTVPHALAQCAPPSLAGPVPADVGEGSPTRLWGRTHEGPGGMAARPLRS